MNNEKEIMFAIWLSENTHFENMDAIILKKTGRLYYKDTPADMQTLYKMFEGAYTLKEFIKKNFGDN